MLVVLVGVCVLLPLAVYFFLLAQLNRRHHPVIVAGIWDFAGVLFALSGLLLLGGPFILASINEDWREFWFRSPFRSSDALGDTWWYVRLGIWGMYFGTIFFGAVFSLRKRSRVTSIYNVDADVFNQVLGQVLDKLGLEWRRVGNRLYVAGPVSANGPISVPTQGQSSGENGGSRMEDGGSKIEERGDSKSVRSERGLETRLRPSILNPPLSNDSPEVGTSTMTLVIEPFSAMRHLTLYWPPNASPVRQEIELELAKTLSEAEMADNPAGGWLMSIAIVLMCLVFFGLLMLVLFYIFLLIAAGQ